MAYATHVSQPFTESNFYLKGGGTRASKETNSSCSSRIGLKVNAKNANADLINIKEEILSNNNNTVTDYVNDAEILNIKNNTNGNNNTLIDEQNDISAERTGRTENKNKIESASHSLLARELVVRFVQNSSLMRWTDRNETLTKTEEQTLIYLVLMT